eukprot:TRINITY_DN5001_c0_g1_i1.p1 TRINITY_DN5001_c0_g1~~TRINITY_DN5001_c0_g1_i1.p1  ORF type:complete len:146 (-),score=29.71 TRINITY_DN5001_c0_g1_i1:27-464(-)
MLADAVVKSDYLKDFSGIPIQEIKNDDLEKLAINSSGCSDTEAIVLAIILEKYDILTSIDMRNNFEIGKDGAKRLAEAIFKNTTLETLSGIPILKIKQNDETITKLPKGISACSDTEAIVLGRALKINTVLTDVNLKENFIWPLV